MYIDAAGAGLGPATHTNDTGGLCASHRIFRQDQSRNLEEITKDSGLVRILGKTHRKGIVVESWYVAMGMGHVVTLRVPPARLREVNRSVEQNAWKVFRTEFYPTYDFREIARGQREKALAK